MAHRIGVDLGVMPMKTEFHTLQNPKIVASPLDTVKRHL